MSTQGYRGYIGFMAERSVPQHIQQLVIRDYCLRHGLRFLLSATEYVMGGTMMLDALKEDTAGIVMYSMFLLPKGRRAFPKPVHFAAENCQYTPDMNETLDLMDLYADHRTQLHSTLAYLNA